MKDVFNIMEAKVCEMAKNERVCTLLLDEMSIQQVIEYCNSSDEIVGKISSTGYEGMASKALVFLLRGIGSGSRWKQIFQYEFVGESTRGGDVLDIIIQEATVMSR